jgi:hypothetical protein
MKALGMTPGDAAISSAEVEKYALVFTDPISVVQIRALAALFGWTPPDGLEGVFVLSV